MLRCRAGCGGMKTIMLCIIPRPPFFSTNELRPSYSKAAVTFSNLVQLCPKIYLALLSKMIKRQLLFPSTCRCVYSVIRKSFDSAA
jgi:hypothetical protein